MTQRAYSDHYRKYKEAASKSSPKKVPPERARQNALSAAGGLVDRPKDFDWIEKNIPCQAACPARTDIPSYLEAIARGDFDAAYRINLADNVFPAVLGRVCTRPCEPACRHGWTGLGEPVAICFSKRSAADFLSRTEPVDQTAWYAASGRKIAVVGGGAAGLAAARDLALLGHAVTVFEKQEKPGGMMRYGIPQFRLPRAIVEREIDQVRRCGVEIRCGETVDEARLSDLAGQFDAVLLAAGTTKPEIPQLPGIELTGVLHGLPFLMAANEGEPPSVGKNVVVIGGGFTAVDCARTARRLGAENVRMVYRRSEAEMYITPGEVEEMRHEGIAFETLKSPLEIVGEAGRVTGVRFVQTRIVAKDADGRGTFEPVTGSEELVSCDTVLLGTGQKADAGWVPAQKPSNLFLAGDFVTGARSLIDAIAHGRKQAREIDEFLMGSQRLADMVEVQAAEETGRTREMNEIPRQPMPVIEPATRGRTEEVEKGFGQDAARTEASRCYLCHFKFEIDNDLCIYCDRCLKVKPVEKCIVKVASLVYDAEERITGYVASTGAKDYNMLYIDQAQCTRCGACKEVCPVECITLQKATRCTIPTEANR